MMKFLVLDEANAGRALASLEKHGAAEISIAAGKRGVAEGGEEDGERVEPLRRKGR